MAAQTQNTLPEESVEEIVEQQEPETFAVNSADLEEETVDESAYKGKDAFGRGVIGRLRGGKAGAYLSKKAKERSDMNKKNDPGAAKKGYALSVTDKDKAMKKARRKGLSPKHPTTNYNRKLPEGIEDQHADAYERVTKHLDQVKSPEHKAKFQKQFDKHQKSFEHHYEKDTGQEHNAVSDMHDLANDIKKHNSTAMKKETLDSFGSSVRKVAKGADKTSSVQRRMQKRQRDHERGGINEKTLTPAEKKKREDVAKAIERDNPNMPMDKKMAIATATAKRTAESSIKDRTRAIMERALNKKT